MVRQQLNIRVGDDERRAWTQAAEKAKLDLSTWIRTACNVAANQPPAAATCPHPPKERTSYGVCQRCKAVVVP